MTKIIFKPEKKGCRLRTFTIITEFATTMNQKFREIRGSLFKIQLSEIIQLHTLETSVGCLISPDIEGILGITYR